MLANGGGTIVNISSIGGVVGSPGSVAYTAAKHAVIGMTRVALELAQQNIRVNAVLPGAVKTPMSEAAKQLPEFNLEAMLATKVPMGREAEPEELAPLVLFLASDESSYSTEAVYAADGGWTA